MRIAIIGSRACAGLTIDAVLSHIPPEAREIVSGGAQGVDAFAEEAARRLHLPCTVFRPDYETLGRMAPLSRNRQIVDYADLVLAFWDYHSRGTAHALSYCVESQRPFRILPLEP